MKIIRNKFLIKLLQKLNQYLSSIKQFTFFNDKQTRAIVSIVEITETQHTELFLNLLFRCRCLQ